MVGEPDVTTPLDTVTLLVGEVGEILRLFHRENVGFDECVITVESSFFSHQLDFEQGLRQL